MYCPHCGKETVPGAHFCDQCGADISALSKRGNQGMPQDNLAQTVAPTAQPRTQGASSLAKIAIPAALACALIAGVGAAVLPGLLGNNSAPEATNQQSASAPAAAEGEVVAPEQGATPTTLDSAGNAVQALARPGFITGAEPQDAPFETTCAPYTIEPNLANVINGADFTGDYSPVDVDSLVNNGFAIRLTKNAVSHAEFFDTYESNRYIKMPNFVTTDSMMHTYHLYFMYLLKNTESSYLSATLLSASQTMLAESTAQLDDVRGTAWEDAARRNVAFFAIGCALLDPATIVPEEVASVVSGEVAKIEAAGGIEQCALTGAREDYSQYAPRSYYVGDEALERYFRAMMWFGRINFTQSDEELDRSAALMTLALNGQANAEWESIYAVTSFFAGASDDCGYYEYMPIITTAWGGNATAADLAASDEGWQTYHAMTANMPAPKINSVVVDDEGEDADHLEEEKGFRFMGQRFTMDAAVFQNLIYSQVGPNAQGAQRMLPNALDIPAAFGSDEALAILEDKGETSYSGYTENMAEMRDSIANAPEGTWTASLSAQWLHTLKPLLTEKSEGWPVFMQSPSWTRKGIQTFLGSYTELKHDTALYAKQVMAEMGGGGIEDKDDRGYVEPEPVLYERLAKLSQATKEGLARYGIISDEDAANLDLLSELSLKLQEISIKELRDEVLTDDEYELIRSYGGQIEHFFEVVYRNETDDEYIQSRDFPAALVTDVATDPDGGRVLELGTGSPSVIYVVVPVDGSLRVASGTCFSFYQFDWPLNDRLTDSKWRQMMGLEMMDGATSNPYGPAAVEPQDWTMGFSSKPQSW